MKEKDTLKKLDLAMTVLTFVWQDTLATEIGDALDIQGGQRHI